MANPSFLVLGAARSGTTALMNILGQLPEVSISAPKEPHFLAFANRRFAFSGSWRRDQEALLHRHLGR